MSSINQQPLANSLNLADQLLVWSTSNGDSRRTSITALLALLEANITAVVAAGAGIPIFLPSVGGINALVASAAVGVTVAPYYTGQTFILFPVSDNSAATTINIAGLGVKQVRINAAACAGGELKAGSPVVIVYDGVYFQIAAPSGFVTLAGAQTVTNKTLGAGSILTGPLTMTLGADADGDIYYRTANVLTRLAKGTALQMLRMNAGVTAPEWATPPVTAGLVLIQRQVAANVAAIDFTTGIDGTYDEYIVTITEALPATNDDNVCVRVSQDGGATFKSGAADYIWQGTRGSTADIAATGNAGDSKMIINANGATNTGVPTGVSGECRFFNPTGTTKWKLFSWAEAHERTATQITTVGSGSFILNAAAINAIRFYYLAGNITSGIFSLYGVRKS